VIALSPSIAARINCVLDELANRRVTSLVESCARYKFDDLTRRNLEAKGPCVVSVGFYVYRRDTPLTRATSVLVILRGVGIDEEEATRELIPNMVTQVVRG
jgi:hypothetical protein